MTMDANEGIAGFLIPIELQGDGSLAREACPGASGRELVSQNENEPLRRLTQLGGASWRIHLLSATPRVPLVTLRRRAARDEGALALVRLEPTSSNQIKWPSFISISSPC